jgi:hypothetical protein
MSCLFDSLASYFTKIDGAQLRQLICTYLQTNPSLYQEIDTEKAVLWETKNDLNQYIRQMRQSSTWGGAIEIMGFCNLFRLNVTVHLIISSKNKCITFTPTSRSGSSSNGTIHITWTGNHYQPHKI